MAEHTQVAFELDRNTVTVVITCKHRYEAMALYDQMIESARAGRVSVSLEIAPPIVADGLR